MGNNDTHHRLFSEISHGDCRTCCKVYINYMNETHICVNIVKGNHQDTSVFHKLQCITGTILDIKTLITVPVGMICAVYSVQSINGLMFHSVR